MIPEISFLACGTGLVFISFDMSGNTSSIIAKPSCTEPDMSRDIFIDNMLVYALALRFISSLGDMTSVMYKSTYSGLKEQTFGSIVPNKQWCMRYDD